VWPTVLLARSIAARMMLEQPAAALEHLRLLPVLRQALQLGARWPRQAPGCPVQQDCSGAAV
jgi:hypothetical protein